MTIRNYVGPAFTVFALALPNAIFLSELASGQRAGASGLAGATLTVQQALLVAGCTGLAISAALAAYRFAPARRALHLALFFILLDVFYRLAYGGPVTPGLLRAVPETSQRESLELLAGHPALTLFLSGVALLGLFAMLFAWRRGMRFSGKGCLLGAAVSAFMILAALALSRLNPYAMPAAVIEEVQGVFPVDIAVSFGALALDGFHTRRQAAARAAFAFTDPRLRDAASRRNGKEVYVIVVGETSRRQNWSLFGYARRTNPRLGEIGGDLVLLKRMTSNATNTILSLPLALTRAAPALRDAERTEKSIVTLLKQAGFSTYWISNQERPALASSPITQIALEADHVSFPDDDLRAGVGDRFDSNLIGRLSEVLTGLPEAAKAVIFLHMEGSHFSYRERYPPNFAFFPDGHDAPRQLPAHEMQLIDEYDNSVLFTDSVLREAIDRLAGCRCRAGLIFFSDHGERLFDNGLKDGDFGHGFPIVARQEIEIPFLVWLSSAYRQSEPSMLESLKANSGSAAQLHNLFETIVDMTGVDYDHRRATLSLFSDHWQPPTHLEVLGLNEDVVTLPLDAVPDLSTNPH